MNGEKYRYVCNQENKVYVESIQFSIDYVIKIYQCVKFIGLFVTIRYYLLTLINVFLNLLND